MHCTRGLTHGDLGAQATPMKAENQGPLTNLRIKGRVDKSTTESHRTIIKIIHVITVVLLQKSIIREDRKVLSTSSHTAKRLSNIQTTTK
jgi:hypothetical protein